MSPEQLRSIILDFSRDWVPYSPDVGLDQHPVKKVKNIRPARGLERCCACTAHDPQSGMIYCGRLAVVMADVVGQEGCITALCAYHERRIDDFEVET